MGGDEKEIIRVLLVDDDEDEYVVVRDLFREIDPRYQVRWFSRYHEGLVQYETGAYRLCLLDYYLGEKTGMDFLRECRTYTRRTPIILFTRQGGYELEQAVRKAGAAVYLDKNELSLDSLERSVRETLEGKA